MASLIKALLLGLGIGLIGIITSLTPVGLAIEENVGLDQLFMFRGQRPAPTDVVIISIDKESARDLNLAKEPVKWPRSLHAQLIDRLAARGARVIGFDVLFKEQRSIEENEQFARSIQAANNVVLFQYLDKRAIATRGQSIISGNQTYVETLVPPIPILADAAIALAPFALPKVPAKVSQIWMYKSSAGDVPTLPAMMFQIYAYQVYDEFRTLLANVDPESAAALPTDKTLLFRDHNAGKYLINLRNRFIEKPALAARMLQQIEAAEFNSPAFNNNAARLKKINLLRALVKLYSGKDSQYLNYYGPARSLHTIPFSKVINLPVQPGPDESHYDFSGKAVFVGLSEPIQLERVDTFYTPFSQENGVDISGIEIGATAFANLLENMTVKPLPASLLIGLLLGWGLLMGLTGRLLPTPVSISGFAGLSVAYLSVSFYLFNASAIWVPIITPLLIQMPIALFTSVLLKYVETNKERKKIRAAFGYFLPDNIVDDIANNLSLGKTSHELNIGTCMATDAEQYTALSEKLTPNDLGALMNQYYETLFTPVKKHHGFVSDIIGDAMMAIWTTLDSARAHRQCACEAAIEMKTGMRHFNQSGTRTELPTRIGMHCGEILLGNIGAVNHYEYRAVGDTVNTASRIQGLNKQLGTYLLVSADVVADLNLFLTRELGDFLLVGKSKPIVIHELIQYREKATPKQKSLCKEFAGALHLFQNQSWELAREKFNQIINKYNNDGPARYYLALCKKYIENPPDVSWNKIITVSKK